MSEKHKTKKVKTATHIPERHVSYRAMVMMARFEIRQIDIMHAQQNIYVFDAYNDGTKTIGFGSTHENGDPAQGAVKSNHISFREAYRWFKNELGMHEKSINEYCAEKNIHLTNMQFDAVVSRRYNFGNAVKPMAVITEHGPHSKAARSIMGYDYIKQVQKDGSYADGLVFRRATEALCYTNCALTQKQKECDKNSVSWDQAKYILDIAMGKHPQLIAKADGHKKRHGKQISFLTTNKSQHGRVKPTVSHHHAREQVAENTAHQSPGHKRHATPNRD